MDAQSRTMEEIEAQASKWVKTLSCVKEKDIEDKFKISWEFAAVVIHRLQKAQLIGLDWDCKLRGFPVGKKNP